MRPDDRVRVLHMIEAAEAVQSFVAGKQPIDLGLDRMLSLAAERAIEIIGEAASKVSTETRNEAQRVPWAQIVAMRNRLVHAYFDVDAAMLWKTATQEIPLLLAELRALLE